MGGVGVRNGGLTGGPAATLRHRGREPHPSAGSEQKSWCWTSRRPATGGDASTASARATRSRARVRRPHRHRLRIGLGGGLVDVKNRRARPTSVDTRRPTPSVPVRSLSGLDVVAQLDRQRNVASISTNGGGGFVSIGSADTSAVAGGHDVADHRRGARSPRPAAPHDRDAGATGGRQRDGGHERAGLGSGVHANASLTLRYSTTADIPGCYRGCGPDGPLAPRCNGNSSATAQGGGPRRHRRGGEGTVDAKTFDADVHPRHCWARVTGERTEVSAIVDALYARSYARSKRRPSTPAPHAGRDGQRGAADRGADRGLGPAPRGYQLISATRCCGPGRLPRARPLHPRRTPSAPAPSAKPSRWRRPTSRPPPRSTGAQRVVQAQTADLTVDANQVRTRGPPTIRRRRRLRRPGSSEKPGDFERRPEQFRGDGDEGPARRTPARRRRSGHDRQARQRRRHRRTRQGLRARSTIPTGRQIWSATSQRIAPGSCASAPTISRRPQPDRGNRRALRLPGDRDTSENHRPQAGPLSSTILTWSTSRRRRPSR